MTATLEQTPSQATDQPIQPQDEPTPTPARLPRPERTELVVLLLLMGVLCVGASLRLLNVDWDEGEHLHPDERYVTMVTDGIRFPGASDELRAPPEGCDEWGSYFDGYCSPLNPYNRGYGSYAYGTLPIFSTRWVGEWLNGACIDPTNPDEQPSRLKRLIAGALFDDVEGCVAGNFFTAYWRVHLLGRMLSALADLGAILFLFLIGRRLYGSWVGLLAATLHAFAALPIQQAHFYAVDSYTSFCITAAGYFVVRAAQGGRWRDFCLAGLGFGLALACKVSVWPFVGVIVLGAVLYYVRGEGRGARGDVSPRSEAEGEGRERVLDGLMTLALVIFFFLIVAIAIFGIWSAVKIAFYFAIAALVVGAGAFYVLRPGDRRKSASVHREPSQPLLNDQDLRQLVNWENALLLALVGFLIVVGTILGNWSAIRAAFYLATATLVISAGIFYNLLLPKDKRKDTNKTQLQPPLDESTLPTSRRVSNRITALIFAFGCSLMVIDAILGSGLAISIALFFLSAALIIGASAFYIFRPEKKRKSANNIDGALARLLLAGLSTFIAFRVAQPYAFVGTNFDAQRLESHEYDWLRDKVPDTWYTLNDKLPAPLRALLLPDPRFISTLASVNEQMTGEADLPWGHQWTNRLPFVFPWVNMVFWGLGLPLGLAAWAAWGLAAWELWRGKRRMQHFIPWAWVTLLFLYQGTQWVKSIRYLLAIYPFIILLGAWLLMHLWQVASGKWQVASGEGRGALCLSSLVLRLPLVLVLIGTILWGWGFTRIYARPLTRNTASRWMVENIPTAATLHYEAEGESQTHFLRLSPTHTYTDNMQPLMVRFYLPQAGVVTGITFTHLSDPNSDATAEDFQVTLSADAAGAQILSTAQRSMHLEQSQQRLGDAQYFDLPPVPLDGATEYYLSTQVVSGAPVQLDTTVIANEYPDDSLPTRVDGVDPFGGMYRGLQSSGDNKTHWDLGEDANKLYLALEWLDEADVIALSSNRGYASIPRIPGRYPLAITFYRELFAERLGFELLATFASYPTIGPFQFPDQETPFAPGEPALIRDEIGSISIYLPPAEEAFSVYDHPQVFIFGKTPEYSRQRVEEILGQVHLGQVVWMKALDATVAPTAFALKEEEVEIQRRGGTWRDIFDADSLLNRWPLLSVLVWWLLLQALGLAAFPLLFVSMPGLRDRGWPLAKTLGLLLLATLAWWAASTHLCTYSRLLIFAIMLLLALVGIALTWQQRRELAAWASRERRAILVSELLFSGMFLAFLLIRYGNPDLWHPAMGGERPMDFAFLNAIIKSTHFPPYDPWMAGDYLNYYYYGFVIAGTPIKLLGILPEIAYNLLLPTFFALTGAGAYSAAYNLVASGEWRVASGEWRVASGDESSQNEAEQEEQPQSEETKDDPANTESKYPIPNPQSPIPNPQSLIPIFAGLIAALFVMVLGNMGEAKLVADGLHKLGSRDFEFQSTIPGLEPLVIDARGLYKIVLDGEAMPWNPEWPYWNPSRAIPVPTPPPEQAGETPPITEFPFFTFLYSDLHAHLMALPLTLLALGMILNWALDADFWLLHVHASALRRRRWFSALLGLALGGIAIGALRPTNTWDYITYLPLLALALTVGYVTQRVGPQDFKLDFKTLRDGVISVGGRFTLLAALSYIFFLPYVTNFATGSSGFDPWTGSKTPLWAYFGIHGLFLFPITTWLLLNFRRVPQEIRAWLKMSEKPRATSWALIALFALAMLTLFATVAGYQVALAVLPLGSLALLTLLRRETGPAGRLAALLSGVGLALTLWVELAVLNQGDVGRMNTVFKFYLQVWVLFGVCGAACLGWIAHRFVRPNRRWQAWLIVLALLVTLTALYPILATRAKVNDRWMRQIGPGLDSMEWMPAVSDQYGRLVWEYQALMWLRENVDGSPVVAEGARAQPYRSQRARVATYTGLPIIIGYPWHSRQQRTSLSVDVIGQRERDVDQLYNTPDPWLAKQILDRYDVSLIYVGAQERSDYDPVGINKFEQMAQTGLLRPVYSNTGVTIYKVNE